MPRRSNNRPEEIGIQPLGAPCAVIKSFDSSTWLLLENPSSVVACTDYGEVLPCLHDVQARLASEGGLAVVVLSYEASPAFDSAMKVRSGGLEFPLLHVAHYPVASPVASPLSLPSGSHEAGPWNLPLEPADYAAQIDHIHGLIESGDTYQVNFTMQMRSRFRGDPLSFFQALYRCQPTDLCAFVDLGDYAVCSGSPELFFEMDKGRVVSRPMKGTAPRGLTYRDDLASRDRLLRSAKDRAENVMIVDMIRNDVGRIAPCGEVTVEKLFWAECFPTVWQMTSTVSCRSSASFPEVLSALFPCSSITGAPKIRTMEIISETETDPRGIYTGAIGLWGPGNRARMNVAIRTAVVDKKSETAAYGVGGGIVSDSVAQSEYEECRTKTRILTDFRPEFSLLETMLWRQADGFMLLEYHLERLSESAGYFGFPMDQARLAERLKIESGEFGGTESRVRVLLQADGSISTEWHALAASRSEPVELRLARRPVDSGNLFLYHKTTNRKVYTEALQEGGGADDVLLWNERGEVTESTIANVFFESDGILLTPPVSSGLLAGTYRRHLLQSGTAVERVIHKDEISTFSKLFVANSVRGLQEAYLT